MRFFMLVLVFGLTSAAHAASFDCSRASRPTEKAICSDAKLSADDGMMAGLYRTDLDKLSTTSVGLLRVDQLQWLAWVQQICHADAPQASADTQVKSTLETKALAACLQPLFLDRMKQLRIAVVRRDGLSFLTRTQYLAAEDVASAGGPAPHPGFGTLQASWPVADSDDEDWIAWNKTVEDRLMKMADTGQGGDGSASRPLTWNEGMAQEQDVELRVHIKSVEHDRVTSGLSMNGMAHGGAHPYESWQTMTWLLAPKRAMRADDVFAPESNWKQVLADACWKQLQAGDGRKYLFPQVKGPEAKELQQTVLEVGNWTLEHDGLHISYPEYAVSPRYAPMDDAVIPWGELQKVILPAFVQP